MRRYTFLGLFLFWIGCSGAPAAPPQHTETQKVTVDTEPGVKPDTSPSPTPKAKATPTKPKQEAPKEVDPKAKLIEMINDTIQQEVKAQGHKIARIKPTKELETFMQEECMEKFAGAPQAQQSCIQLILTSFGFLCSSMGNLPIEEVCKEELGPLCGPTELAKLKKIFDVCPK